VLDLELMFLCGIGILPASRSDSLAISREFTILRVQLKEAIDAREDERLVGVGAAAAAAVARYIWREIYIKIDGCISRETYL